MKLNRTNTVLAVVLAAMVIGSLSVRDDYDRPNYEIALGYDMTYSPAYGAYAPNGNFTDGRTLQYPVPGTVARGAPMPIHYEATKEDAERAGKELSNPIDPRTDEGKAAIERGAESYRVFCALCHGPRGMGDGPVPKHGYPPPPPFATGKSMQMKDGQLFHILTHGQTNMPDFAAQLPAERRWEVIAYVRDLQRSALEQAKQPTKAASEPETP